MGGFCSGVGCVISRTTRAVQMVRASTRPTLADSITERSRNWRCSYCAPVTSKQTTARLSGNDYRAGSVAAISKCFQNGILNDFSIVVRSRMCCCEYLCVLIDSCFKYAHVLRMKRKPKKNHSFCVGYTSLYSLRYCLICNALSKCSDHLRRISQTRSFQPQFMTVNFVSSSHPV